LSYWRERPEFWGIDYASCASREPIEITCNKIELNASYDYQFAKDFYVGAAVDFSYKVINEIADKTYLNGQKLSYITTGVGASVQYDSRDHVGNPTRGGNVILRGMVYPSFFGTNPQTICRITFQANYYQKLWKGAVLAFDAYTQINTPDTPWALREESGGKFRLRGYYEGRYIDNNLLSVQAELRQKLFWRLGLTAFGGFGALFPNFEALRAEHLLYTAGVGLRLEFKHNVNLRVDYGFGRRDPVSGRFTGAFVVTLNEAF
ncbi:MAG: BamA/TamA family outer membrane protein, partial [Bacteroidales bacterium]|nr:BamA/TamA family outer membrane protein [Bacteroidales bacterium]